MWWAHKFSYIFIISIAYQPGEGKTTPLNPKGFFGERPHLQTVDGTQHPRVVREWPYHEVPHMLR